jgi:hypothetical protein
LFSDTVYKNVPDNLSPKERQAMKEFRSRSTENNNLIIRLQDKGSNFVFLEDNLEQNKVSDQMDKGAFQILDEDPTLETVLEINNWIEKWKSKGLSDKWIRFIYSNNTPHAGVNYRLIKTHKTDNPARIITSGCGIPPLRIYRFLLKHSVR